LQEKRGKQLAEGIVANATRAVAALAGRRNSASIKLPPKTPKPRLYPGPWMITRI
jgi:hypothetical protein